MCKTLQNKVFIPTIIELNILNGFLQVAITEGLLIALRVAAENNQY